MEDYGSSQQDKDFRDLALGEISEIDDCLDETHDEAEEYREIVGLNSRTVKEDAENNRIVDIPVRGSSLFDQDPGFNNTPM